MNLEQIKVLAALKKVYTFFCGQHKSQLADQKAYWIDLKKI
jgi:hypothetical protein